MLHQDSYLISNVRLFILHHESFKTVKSRIADNKLDALPWQPMVNPTRQ